MQLVEFIEALEQARRDNSPALLALLAESPELAASLGRDHNPVAAQEALFSKLADPALVPELVQLAAGGDFGPAQRAVNAMGRLAAAPLAAGWSGAGGIEREVILNLLVASACAEGLGALARLEGRSAALARVQMRWPVWLGAGGRLRPPALDWACAAGWLPELAGDETAPGVIRVLLHTADPRALAALEEVAQDEERTEALRAAAQAAAAERRQQPAG